MNLRLVTPPPVGLALLENDRVVIRIVPELIGSARLDSLKRQATDHIDRGAKAVVLDFVDATYLDGSGLAALVAIDRYATSLGASLTIARVHADLWPLFEATGLADWFTFADAV